MMRYLTLLIPFALMAVEPPKTPAHKASHYVPLPASDAKSVMIIDPKQRAQDLVQAYKDLMRDQTSTKIYFRTVHGKTITNIVEAKPSTNGTLLIFKISSKSGLDHEFVFTDDIVEVGHT